MQLLLLLGVLLIAASGAKAADPTFRSSAGKLAVQTVARGLVHPWSLVFLPD